MYKSAAVLHKSDYLNNDDQGLLLNQNYPQIKCLAREPPKMSLEESQKVKKKLERQVV